jgi:hypothetical protein
MLAHGLRSLRALGVASALLGCAATPPAPVVVTAPGPAEPEGGRVEKVREKLQVAPWELAFNGVRGESALSETVNARNLVDELVEVRAILVMGEQASVFRLQDVPALPARLGRKGSVSVTVGFSPPPDAPIGVHRAQLRFQTGPTPDDGPAVDLSALVTRGRAGEGEPPLQQVVDALGFSVEVGTADLHLGTGEEPVGGELRVTRFQRARPAPVAMNPVARFAPAGPVTFGYYLAGGTGTPALEDVAGIAEGQDQILNPEIDAGGQTTFDPGDKPFGLWLKSGSGLVFSDDQQHPDMPRHAMRVYPLRARGGAVIPNTYLVAVDETGTGAYQDCVFVLWNARPADSK